MKEVIDAHKQEYECSPDILVSAPGRVHLLGEHSWFCKDKTLSMSVDIPVYIALSVRSDTVAKFHFVQTDERKKTNVTNLKIRKEDRWANVLKAMIYGFTSGGYSVMGMNVTIWCQVPPAIGFGMMNAIKIAFAFALRNVFEINCSDVQFHQTIERGNKLFLGIENYLSDIFTTLYSKPNSVILTDYATNSYEVFPLDFDDISILLTDSKVPRVSVWNESSIAEPANVLLLGELKDRKSHIYGGWQYEESPTEVNEVLSVVAEPVRQRLRYIIMEHKFILDTVNALKNKDFSAFCKVITYSQDALSDLFHFSCPEIDWLIKRVVDFDQTMVHNPNGCSRITGKGYGRCTYTIIRNFDVENYNIKLQEYERIFGFHPKCYNVKSAGGVQICDFS